jgi:peptidyl-prolyl cis-trans isomerase C
MKKSVISHHNSVQIMVISSLMLLPGCSLLDSLFGPSDQEEAKRELNREAAAKNESLDDAALDVLREDIAVTAPDDELTGDVLITMNGKPIVTVDSLKIEEEKLLEANPQLKSMLALMDQSQFERNLAEGLMNQALLDQDIKEKGDDKTDAYRKEIKEGIKAVERMVNTKFFTQGLDVRVADADVRKFYESNKDSMPQLIISRGGVKAMGIPFDTAPDAKTFAQQVQTQGNDIKKAAQGASLTDKVRDFATVNQQSMGIDAELKDKILAFTKFPTVEVIAAKDGKTWTIVATGKEETQYRPYDQIKTEIKEYLEKEEQAKRFDEKISTLKKKFNIKMNEAFFTAEPSEPMDLEQALPEDLISQMEEDDIIGTVAYHDAHGMSAI